MCGLFGFIGKGGARPDLNMLGGIAVETQRRGPHAYGFAWVDSDLKVHSFRRPGAIADNLDDLERLADAVAIVGHCRWATQGDPEDNRNNHPHRVGRGYLVHNGKIPEWADIVADRGFEMATDCDSEVLTHLVESDRGMFAARVGRAMTCTASDIAVMAIWSNPLRVVLGRRGKPLHLSGEDEGIYFASTKRALPGKPKVVKQGTVFQIVPQVDTFKITSKEF